MTLCRIGADTFYGTEPVTQLSGWELQGSKRFNHFVVLIYIRSSLSSRSAIDAPFKDMQLISRLKAFDDDWLKNASIKMIKIHYWYLSHELATQALFSAKVIIDEKEHFVTCHSRHYRTLRVTPLDNTATQHHRSETFGTFSDSFKFHDSFLEFPIPQ